jgi:hypothetical protein
MKRPVCGRRSLLTTGGPFQSGVDEDFHLCRESSDRVVL